VILGLPCSPLAWSALALETRPLDCRSMFDVRRNTRSETVPCKAPFTSSKPIRLRISIGKGIRDSHHARCEMRGVRPSQKSNFGMLVSLSSDSAVPASQVAKSTSLCSRANASFSFLSSPLLSSQQGALRSLVFFPSRRSATCLKCFLRRPRCSLFTTVLTARA